MARSALASPAGSALVVAAVLVFALAASPVHAKLPESNVVSQWLTAAQNQVATAGVQNQLSAKQYALVSLAIHRAISAGGAPPAVLAAFAGHTVLSALFPWQQGKFDGLIAKQLADVSAADKKQAAESAVPIAAKLVRERVVDESTSWAGFKPAPAGTLWAYQATPNQMFALYPQLAKAAPFALSAQEVDGIASNKDASKGPVFAPARNDYAETFKYGSKDSKARSQYDTDSAFFWADGANTSAITGHWFDVAREVLPDGLSLADTALFFARAAAAAYDASIAAWKLKYSTLAWRPITAFRSGYPEQAGQPAFKADGSWEPLLATPPHPEYPSGHQASVGAVLEVLLRTLGGKDDVTLRIGSEGTPALKRTYKSLTAAANEVGDSRLYGGVHYKSSNVDGLALGRLVGSKAYDRIQPAGKSNRRMRA